MTSPQHAVCTDGAAPSVSVIIPALNAAPHIATAIQSALDQTYPVYEVVVVDGGSTDGTQGIVRKFDPPRVRLIDQRPCGRKGIAGGRNVGIEVSTGDWIAFLDADDWWDARKIEAQLIALKQNRSAALCYTGHYAVDDDTGRCEKVLAHDPAHLWPLLRWRNVIMNSSVLASRSALLLSGGFREDLSACEDWELWVRLGLNNPFVAVRDCMSYYRIADSGTSWGLERHVRAIQELATSTMLKDCSPFLRLVYRQRFYSTQLFGAAIISDRMGIPGRGLFLFQSIAHWPSPLFEPRRFAMTLRLLCGDRLWRFIRWLAHWIPSRIASRSNEPRQGDPQP